MIATCKETSAFEAALLGDIKDAKGVNVEFENIHFMCESITDAGGRRFESVIHCRDCKFRATRGASHRCERIAHDGPEVTFQDYCSRGERWS